MICKTIVQYGQSYTALNPVPWPKPPGCTEKYKPIAQNNLNFMTVCVFCAAGYIKCARRDSMGDLSGVSHTL